MGGCIIAKFVKIFSLESFPLCDTCLHRTLCTHVHISQTGDACIGERWFQDAFLVWQMTVDDCVFLT